MALALALGVLLLAKWSGACIRSGQMLYLGQFGVALVHTVVSTGLLLLLAMRSRVVAYVVLPIVLFLWAVPTYLHVTMGPCMYSELIWFRGNFIKMYVADSKTLPIMMHCETGFLCDFNYKHNSFDIICV